MNPLKRTHTLAGLLAGATLLAALGGCAPLVAGSVATGVMVAADRRTSGAQLEDEGIELRAVNRLHEQFGDRAHINITSYNRRVLLTGEVPSADAKQAAEATVSQLENVRAVVNELVVDSPSGLRQRSADTLVTTRVKASLVDARDLSANAFKVVTERATVYLMGRVTEREAKRVTDIARTVQGSERVVRLMEITSEEKLARIKPAPAEAPKSATKP